MAGTGAKNGGLGFGFASRVPNGGFGGVWHGDIGKAGGHRHLQTGDFRLVRVPCQVAKVPLLWDASHLSQDRDSITLPRKSTTARRPSSTPMFRPSLSLPLFGWLRSSVMIDKAPASGTTFSLSPVLLLVLWLVLLLLVLLPGPLLCTAPHCAMLTTNPSAFLSSCYLLAPPSQPAASTHLP